MGSDDQTKRRFLQRLVCGTIITGSLNSIFTKLQDMQCVENCSDPLKAEYFSQPVLQTIQMFIGEMLCWLPLAFNFLWSDKNRKRILHAADREIRPTLHEHTHLLDPEALDLPDDVSAHSACSTDSINAVLLPPTNPKHKVKTFADSVVLMVPSTCDLIGTTLMNAGLLFTSVSIYQMTRGSLTLFVGVFSVVFLKSHITRVEWAALVVLSLGVFLVGLSGYIHEEVATSSFKPEGVSSTIFGMCLIFGGIMFSACQFVTEEHILSTLEMGPMALVAFEGLYGCVVSILGATIAYYLVGIKEAGRKGTWDIGYGLQLLFSNKVLWTTSILIMVSISSFNFFGISLTNKMNATARSTIDTSRTLLIWTVSLMLGWEKFSLLQAIGFATMVYGTLVFNGVIDIDNSPNLPDWLKSDEATKDNLIDDELAVNAGRR